MSAYVFLVLVVGFGVVAFIRSVRQRSMTNAMVTVGDNNKIPDRTFRNWQHGIDYFLQMTWQEPKEGFPWSPEIAFGPVVLQKMGFCAHEYIAFIRTPAPLTPQKDRLIGAVSTHLVMDRHANAERIEVALMRFIKSPSIKILYIELPEYKGYGNPGYTIPRGKIELWRNADGTLAVTAEGLLTEHEVRTMRGFKSERKKKESRVDDGSFLAAFK